MDFTIEDQQSRTWKKLKAHLEEQLQTLRIQNDAPHTHDGIYSPSQHWHHCGRIAEIKRILDFEKDFIERIEGRNDGVHL